MDTINKTKKAFLLVLLLIMAVSFSGCINLSKKKQKEKEVINSNQGIFKSIDGGRTWEHKVQIEGGGFIDGVKIYSMKMDPQKNNVLYLGTIGNGLYKSENGADSWKKLYDGILSETATVYDVAIEKGNSDIIYAAVLNNGRGELLKSENGGTNWTESYIISESGRAVRTVEIDPISQNVVYIGTAQGGLIKSKDRGKKWETIKWFDNEVEDIIIDFWNNRGMFLRTTSSILKSVDRGYKWEDIGGKIGSVIGKFYGAPPVRNEESGENEEIEERGFTVGKISSITMSSNNPLVLYVTYANLVLVSRDGGYNWQKLNTITPSKTVVGTIPQIKQIGLIHSIVYYGAGNVLYKSENGGITWSSYNIPIIGDVRYTVSDYTDSDIIYVGAFYDPPPPPKKKKKERRFRFIPFYKN